MGTFEFFCRGSCFSGKPECRKLDSCEYLPEMSATMRCSSVKTHPLNPVAGPGNIPYMIVPAALSRKEDKARSAFLPEPVFAKRTPGSLPDGTEIRRPRTPSCSRADFSIDFHRDHEQGGCVA